MHSWFRKGRSFSSLPCLQKLLTPPLQCATIRAAAVCQRSTAAHDGCAFRPPPSARLPLLLPRRRRAPRPRVEGDGPCANGHPFQAWLHLRGGGEQRGGRLLLKGACRPPQRSPIVSHADGLIRMRRSGAHLGVTADGVPAPAAVMKSDDHPGGATRWCRQRASCYQRHHRSRDDAAGRPPHAAPQASTSPRAAPPPTSLHRGMRRAAAAAHRPPAASLAHEEKPTGQAAKGSREGGHWRTEWDGGVRRGTAAESGP